MTLRVMTWNVWARFGPWRERAPGIDAVVKAEDPDLLCLQEVWRDEDGTDQATGLAERHGYHVVSSFDVGGTGLGNAVLSRWPLTDVEILRLPGVPGERSWRTVVAAVAERPEGPVPVYATHLHWPYDGGAVRVEQITFVHAMVARRRRRHGEDRYPPVLAGDLNATPDSAEVRLLTGLEPGLPPGLVFHDTWPQRSAEPGWTWDGANPNLADATYPNRRLDYVLVAWPRPKPLGNPTAVHLAGTEPVDGVVPSDHYAVVADLQT